MATFDKMMSEADPPRFLFVGRRLSASIRLGWARISWGDWTVLQQWGGKHTGLGSQLVVCVETATEGLQRLAAVARQKERRGYQLRELRKGEI